MDRNYTVTRFETDIPVDELISKYFDYSKTHELCKACSGYAGTWACPPFDFEPEDFLRQFSVFHLIVDRIDNSGAANVDEAQDRLFTEKDRYDAEMLELEKATPGSYGMKDSALRSLLLSVKINNSEVCDSRRRHWRRGQADITIIYFFLFFCFFSAFFRCMA